MAGLSKSLTGQQGKFSSVGKELGSSLTMGMQQQFGMAGGMASSLAQALGPVGIAATVAGAGVIALGAASVDAARGWETLMAGVSKTTGAEGAALTQLSNTLLNLSKEMPIAQAEIAKIATVGGTLGVKQSDLPKFVKDTAMASAGWGMSGEEAANSIAGISNAFKVPIADAQKFGSVINTMADSVGGSEKELADFLVRASGIATTFNEGIAATTAFGAVLASINMPMEVAATGLQSMMSYAMADPKRMSLWADTMGISVDALNTKLSEDLYGTLIESSNKVASTGSETDQLALRMKLWGEGGARVSSGLVGMQDKYNEALAMGNEQLATGSSLAQAFGAQGATIDAKWQKFTNTMSTALIHVGTAALPVLGQVLDTMSGLIAKADEFAATTLPAWAQGATDWVNETLGMEEDTPEEIAERKAKIARTAEKTVAKVADTTGYQSYAEAQASAANLGQGTGNSYVDGLNSALDTGLPKALTDAYLGDALNIGKKAAVTAGQQTAEEFTKAQDDYIKAHPGGMSLSNLYDTGKKDTSGKTIYASGDTRIIGGVDHTSDYSKSLDHGTYSTFANGDVTWNLLKAAASGKAHTLQAVISVDGTEYTREFSTLEDTAESATKKIKAEFRDIALDIPKYFKNAGDDISDSLSGALSDGVISFTEKDELKNYIKSLDTLETTYPIQFEASHLDDLKATIEDAVAGTLITFDASEIELNFSRFIAENTAMYNQIYQKTGVISYEHDEKALHDALINAPQEAQDLYAELQSAISSGDFDSLQSVPAIIEELADVAPELLVLKGTTDRLNTAQEEWEDNYRNLGKTTAEASENGDKMDGVFLRTSQNADILSRGFAGMAAAEYDQAVAVKSARSGMEMLYSPIITTKDGLKSLDKPITDLVTQGNALDAVFIDTTTCVGNANLAVTGFADALNVASARISSISTYETRSYAPSVAGTAYSSLNTYAVASSHAFDPIELIQAYNKNLPKFATGAKVVRGGAAVVGEEGTEYVIPESMIKGLYPESKVDYSSLASDMSLRYFLDYPEPEITAPVSYRWSQYPDVPNVAETNTEAIQTAWLSEGQPNSRDVYSGAIRQAQLNAIGKSQVMPWFARGEIEQPDWWVEAATKLSPQYKENWGASKGGTVPSIGNDVAETSGITANATKNGATVADAWSQLYGESFTEGCISTNAPDAALKFTPSASLIAEIGRTWGEGTTAAWNQLYGEAFTEGCIGTNKPDSLLKYTPSASMLAEVARSQGASLWGSEELSGGASTSSGNEVSGILDSIDANTRDTKIALDNTIDVLKLGIFTTSGMQDTKATFETTGNDALVVGLSKEGYVVSYDPRTDTCEGMAFNAPDPSLKTTDKFYLGLTKNSPYRSEDKASGYGWENVAQTDDQALQQLMKIDEESQKTSESSEQTAESTNDVYRTLGQQYALQQKALALGGATLDATGALVSLVGGGSSGGTGLYGSTAGSFWGGLSVGGGGGSIGTGASMSGWGAQASNSIGGNTGTVSIGQGAMYYAEGGITDHPVFGVFGEAGREAFVPISDRAAGRRILPQVMRELGVRTFATGGIAGSGGLSSLVESIGPTTITYAPTINADGLSKSQAQSLIDRSQDKFLEKVAKKQVLSKRRRG